MRDFHSIIEALKLHIAGKKNIRILDKDVAFALGISQANFATIKRRNSTPYESILQFCQREKLCCSEIFFE
ncbi:hypothetical protein KJ877_08530 [bacterium]|nr:hypothetical protein [bacterium]MBU1990742.1 hypothetical protein [bacterium]